MAKKDSEFKGVIEEVVGVLREYETHDWATVLARISWNDNPSKLEIRQINLSKDIIGKGVSFTDEEAERLTDMLIESDYGSVDAMQEAIKRKVSRFTVSSEVDDKILENGLFIDIKMPEDK